MPTEDTLSAAWDIMSFKNLRNDVWEAFEWLEGFLVDKFELKHILHFAGFMYCWNAFTNIIISSLHSFYGLTNIIPSNHNPLAFLARALELAKIFVLIFCGREVAEDLTLPLIGEFKYDSPGVFALFHGEGNFGYAILNWFFVLDPLFAGLLMSLLAAKFYKIFFICLGYSVRKINRLTGLTASFQKHFVTDYDNKKGYKENMFNNWRPLLSKMVVVGVIWACSKIPWDHWAVDATNDVKGIVMILVMFDVFKAFMWQLEYNTLKTSNKVKEAIHDKILLNLKEAKKAIGKFSKQIKWNGSDCVIQMENTHSLIIGEPGPKKIKCLKNLERNYFILFWTIFTMMMIPTLNIYGFGNTVGHLRYLPQLLVHIFGVWIVLGGANCLYSLVGKCFKELSNDRNPIEQRDLQ